MKKFFAALCLLLMCGASHAEEAYDPQHTMLALNMAIVSVHRILATEDRVVLEQEYQNIINNLSLGNIKDDDAMTALYRDLSRIISRKQLRNEDAKIIQTRYESKEEGLLWDIVDNIIASEKDLFGFLENLAVSCVSSYFEYDNAKSELAEGLSGELWQLTKEDITDCENLQERLLSSSWNLLQQYKLPDNYRLVQRTLDDFYKAVNARDTAKRFRMLRALERDFQVYPPYWFYRGKTAQGLGDINEADTCFKRFNEVWRPVLRQDPYKVEALKFGLSKIMKGGNISDDKKREAVDLLELMRENTPREDWTNNIFAGVAYFVLGEKDRGIKIVEANVDFGYGVDVSGIILQQLKADKLNLGTMSSELAVLLKDVAEDKKLAELRRKAEQGDARAQLDLGLMYRYNYNNDEAAKWFHKAAERGHLHAQFILGMIYEKGDGVEQSYKTAYMWYYLASLGGFDCMSNVKELEKKESLFSKPKVSPSEAQEAKEEARRKYDKVKGWY